MTPCACCGEPATRESADGVPLCEGDYWHLLEHWRREFGPTMDETKARALAAYPYGKPGEGEPSEVTETRDAFEKRILAFAAEVRRDERMRVEAELTTLRSAAVEFHWMARRYCDGRMSTTPGSFNALTRDLIAADMPLREPHYARDGMGRGYDGLTDAEADAAQADMPKGHAALEAEWIARTEALRESALDLSRVPEGYRFRTLELWRAPPQTFWCSLVRTSGHCGPYPSGTGPTPKAALDAAIARANEYGETK